MKKRRMIVLSLDGVGSRDLPFLETLPVFSDFLREAAGCRQVTSVYPSLTYPAHTTIVTGRLPAQHGIINNLKLQPEREPSDWFWQRKYIKGTTLYDEAAKRGWKTAAFLWPVTGGAKIRWNMPEVLPNRLWQNQVMVSAINGSPLFQLDLLKRFGHLRDGIRQPQLDDFVFESVLYTLEKHRPELILVHLTDADSQRHIYGVESHQAEEALVRHGNRLNRLLNTLDRLGLKEETDLVILGDHYQKDVKTALYPNYYLVKKGFIEIRKGKVKQWKILARDCDGSCYIYVKDPCFLPASKALFGRLAEREGSGIERIYSREEAEQLGADPQCALMLEAKKGYYFQNGWQKYQVEKGASDHHRGVVIQAATHGYYPYEKGYETFFMASGPDFKPGVRAEKMTLADEGPTLAAALGFSLGRTDGKTMRDLLRLG